VHDLVTRMSLSYSWLMTGRCRGRLQEQQPNQQKRYVCLMMSRAQACQLLYQHVRLLHEVTVPRVVPASSACPQDVASAAPWPAA
jgi:hypothetical protein